MTPTPLSEAIPDAVIAEVHRHKRALMAEHGDDVEALLKDLRNRQKANPRLVLNRPSAVTVRSESANTPPSTTSVTNRQPSIYMGKTIELPDPLFAEINGYAHHVSATPVTVIRQAWNEFRRHHPQESATPPMRNSNPEELLAMVRALRGSISLPADVDDKTLIAEARLEKYGPL